MNLSGIVVAIPPSKFNEGIVALNAIKNIEVHHSDIKTGQVVIVQEASNIDKEIEGLKKIKALPMVTYAEMVYHYLAEDKNLNVIYPDDIQETDFKSTLNKLNQE